MGGWSEGGGFDHSGRVAEEREKGKGKGREVTRRGGFFRYACAMTYMAWGKRRSRRRKGGLRALGIGVGWGLLRGLKVVMD